MPSQSPISTEVQAVPRSASEVGVPARLRESWRWCCRLSIVEPLVAVAWHASFSHALGRRLPTLKGLLLFNSLWLVYAADRLLDVQNLPERTEPETDRHRFAFQFTKGLTCAWVLVCLATVVQAYAVLALREWQGCLLLLLGTCAYLLGLHWRKTPRRWLLSGAKETAITLLFSSGCTLFLWSNGRYSSDLWIPNLLFAGVVLQNLVTLAHLERHIDQAHQSASIFQGVDSSRLHVAIGAIVMLTALGALVTMSLQPGFASEWLSARTQPLLMGVVVSSGLLSWLSNIAGKTNTTNFDKLHLLADVAVLAGAFPLFTTTSGSS